MTAIRKLATVLLPLVLAACTSGGASERASAPASAVAGGTFATLPSWAQEFDKPLDAKDFTLQTGGGGWGENQAQYYTNDADNAYTKDGKLIITAIKVAEDQRVNFGGHAYTSARVVTTLKPMYGRIVWENVTLPQGAGTWPSLWLWPANNKFKPSDMATNPKGDPKLLNGEVNVMEWVGVVPADLNCSAHSYLHHPLLDERQGKVAADAQQPHSYWLEWTPNSLKSGVDSLTCMSYTRQARDSVSDWPYDQPYNLIMSLAMGGNWGGMLANKHGLGPDGVDPKFVSAQLTIGAIRYYPYKNP